MKKRKATKTRTTRHQVAPVVRLRTEGTIDLLVAGEGWASILVQRDLSFVVTRGMTIDVYVCGGIEAEVTNASVRVDDDSEIDVWFSAESRMENSDIGHNLSADNLSDYAQRLREIWGDKFQVVTN